MIQPVKISDALKASDNAMGDGSMVNTIVPEYSSVCPFNLDASLLLLVHKSYFALYNGNGAYVRDLPFEVSASSQPRWSRTDSKLVYFLSGNSVKSCNVSTGAIAAIQQFKEYSTLTSFGESDISDDGNWLVLCGDGKHCFTYRLGQPHISTRTALEGVESLYLTPKNNVLVSYHAIGSARFQGVELFDRNMQFVRQVLPYNPHKDVMLNADGKEVLIHANGADPNPVIAAPSVVMTWLSDGIQKQIFKSDWAFAEHISCPIGKDFFFVDRYDPKNEIPGDILKIWLDGRSEMLCLHGSKAFPPENKYTYQPKVSCNRDGTKLVYASNMGIGTPVNYSDVYMLKLAAEKPVQVNPNLPIRFLWKDHRATIDKDGITILAA